MTIFVNEANQTQHIVGISENDIFLIDGKSTDFNWGPTEDGNGIVVWNEAGFDVLHDVEEIRFSDIRLVRDENGLYQGNDLNGTSQPPEDASADDSAEVQTTKITGITQYVQGTSGNDVFVIEADADAFGWGPTADGEGLVIWNGADFDIVYGVEEIRFNNLTLTLNEDGTYSADEKIAAVVDPADEVSDIVKHFESEIMNKVVSDVGPLDHGLEPGLILGSFPGIQMSDFDGVEAEQGQYKLTEDGQLEFIPNDGEPIHSAAQTITTGGMAQLLTNLSAKTGLTTDTAEMVDTLLIIMQSPSILPAEADIEPELADDDQTDTSSEIEQVTSETTQDDDSTPETSGTQETPETSETPGQLDVSIVGKDVIREAVPTIAGTPYTVKLSEAVEEDTWVTVKLNSGTAILDDGSYRPEYYGNQRFLYYNDEVHKESLSPYFDANPWMKGAVTGVENLNFDFTVTDGHSNIEILGPDEFQLLIKAGESESEGLYIRPNAERVAWVTNSASSLHKTRLGEQFQREEDEYFSIEVLKVGDQTISGVEKEVTITDFLNTPNKLSTPVAIDLSGDNEIGVTGETSSFDKDFDAEVGKTVEFDIDGDGAIDRIEWFDGSGDGILIDNRDGNAANDMDGSRLFGDEGGAYDNGYEKLALFDLDNDGTLKGDELQGIELWVDDGDAKVEAGELQTLADHNITEVSVILEENKDNEGRILLQSTAKTGTGEILLTEDVWFASADEKPQTDYNMEYRFLDTDFMV